MEQSDTPLNINKEVNSIKQNNEEEYEILPDPNNNDGIQENYETVLGAQTSDEEQYTDMETLEKRSPISTQMEEELYESISNK